MPPQQRRRLDEKAPPGWTGQQPRQSSQHRPVGPVNPWPGYLASQQRERPQHLAEQQIEQSKGHAPIIVARWLL
jgi:hypothetical protein